MSCGVGCRHGSDPTWLWCRLTATAPSQPLAWEPPYAAGKALKRQKDKKDQKKKKKNPLRTRTMSYFPAPNWQGLVATRTAALH